MFQYQTRIAGWMMSMMIFSSGCIEQVAPPDIKNIEDKIVVNSIISSGFDQIAVQISFSRKTFGFVKNEVVDAEIITNAVVTIRNGNQQATLPYNSSEEHYVLPNSSFPIKDGETYHLTVEYDGKTISAQATVPADEISGLESVKWNSPKSDQDMHTISLAWADVKGKNNYYRAVVAGAVTFVLGINDENEFEYETVEEHFRLENDGFVSDLNRDGGSLSVRGDGGYLDYDLVKVRIISCDKDYFDYFKGTLANYDDDDDPFSDPAELPSNIEGGLGIFSAVQVSEFSITAPTD